MMDGRFWEAARVVTDFVESDGCSKRVIAYHRRGIRQLADFLDREGLELGAESAARWVDVSGSLWKAGMRKENATVARRMVEALETGSVTPGACSHSGPTENNHETLSGWSREVVDSYADAFESAAAPAERRRYASQFMVRSGLADATPSDVTAKLVLAYVGGRGGDKRVRSLRLRHLRDMLRHMADRGEAPAWLALLADDSFARHAGCFDTVDGLERGGVAPDDCLSMVDGFVGALAERGYAKTERNCGARVVRMASVAMAMNGTGLTRANAEAWLAAVEPLVGCKQWPSYRRVLRLFVGYADSGGIDTSVASSRAGALDRMPGWARDGVDGYLAMMRREGWSESTLACAASACARLASYADSVGRRSWADLTPQDVADWCVADEHKTAEGRACYASKARGFLAYLAEEGTVAPCLWLAARRGHAPKRRVAEVLDAGQVEAVEAMRRAASTPTELRDAAVVSLGLTMGLRSCDVVALRLADIDWRRSTVSLTQQKTGEPIELPLTVAAGNAIYAYLMRGRPKCGSPLVFVKHRAPYDGLSTWVCGKALERTLGDGAPGFHVLRKTFATSLLRGGAGRSEVAEALGHRSERSTEPYLSLDEARMRQCALPLGDLAIGGGDDGGS